MTALSPQSRLLLEAVRHLEALSFLNGDAQSSAVNCFVWTQNPNWKTDAISQNRKRLVSIGLLAKLEPSGRLELTDLGRTALENGNGNRETYDNAVKEKKSADELDPTTRRQLDELAFICSRSAGWVSLDTLKTEWGISRGLCTNAVALQPQRFSIRDDRLFLLSESISASQKNPETMSALEYDEYLCQVDPSYRLRRERRGYRRGGK
jgi:hypothetical protein